MKPTVEFLGGPWDGQTIDNSDESAVEGVFISIIHHPIIYSSEIPYHYDPGLMSAYRVDEHGKARYVETDWDGTPPEDDIDEVEGGG